MYSPNIKDTNHVKEKVIRLKGGIDKSTIIVGDDNTLIQ